MDGDEGPGLGHRAQLRPVFSVLAVVLVAAAAVFGSDLFGIRESVFGSATPSSRPVAVSPFVTVNAHTGHPVESVLSSQPWWQGVRDLSGTTTTGTTASLDFGGGVSQWRAKWTCDTGSLVAALPGQPRPLIDASCPRSGTAYDTRTGAIRLQVTAGGPWTIRVDQQVDVPLVEPPLAAMSAHGSAVISTGTFYGIAQKSVGRIDIYRLDSGSYALRLSSFYVSPNVDLQIRFDPLRAPHSTKQYLSAASLNREK